MYRYPAALLRPHADPALTYRASFRCPERSHIHSILRASYMVKMVSAARPVLGRMAARIVNASGTRSYSSIARVPGTRSINAAGASPLVSGKSFPACSPTLSQPLVPRRYGHTVRIILKEDLPDGRGYSGDVMTVKAGYARNYLVPKKMALYATPENFVRLGVTDPEAETIEEKRARLAAEAAAEEDEEAAADLRAADLLKHYLRNKVLTIKRNVDPSTGAVHPGLVNAQNVREKLSKQLRIDLEDHEVVQLMGKPLEAGHAELEEGEVEKIMEEIGSSEDDKEVEIRQLGEFMAKITLRGDHVVPLKFAVIKR